ncbi:AAA family ATPase [Pantoea sp. PNA 03-3]|uniref:AAA family ATPase n=1 Tax=Pantoea sp. PNA 03-3 TaxID=2135460 RepID=UPI000D7677ED|nr:AAA family ATPase [Pantoea sp. PNA 03-3]PXV75262.1 AAA domain-containing protein [Pantoea sp. PNA 03-3]
MISNPSYLKINRLVITKGGQQLYDETFHDGVNIIRGEHSVGKSTILDMIFYVLGGELKKDDWKYPVDECSNVNAEITINGRIFTLTRVIDSTGGVPHIKIYDGKYDIAMKDADGWSDYGSRRTSDKLSFSEMMFELFNWGQYKSDDYQNLTMHQILRLIYLSQSSDSNRIFRKEFSRSDNENTRIAIAEFLFGLDDLETHSYRQNLLKFERDHENSSAELKAYFELLGNDADLTVEKINEKIIEKTDELKEIENKKSELLESPNNPEDVEEHNLTIERNSAIVKIQSLTNKISLTNNELEEFKIEIQDCILFGRSLTHRMKSLNESKDTYSALGKISFEFCPCCLTPVTDNTENKTGCALCKSTEETTSLEEKYIESLNELQYQQRQNEKIIVSLSEKKEYLEGRLLELNQELQFLQNRLFEISLVSNSRELAITSIIEERTMKLIEINSLQDKLEPASKVDDLKKKREHLNEQIANCRTNIEILEAKNAKRKEFVYSNLSELSTKILEGDSGNEEKFKTATQLSSEIDFAKDRWLLNERVNYSDSSNVVKKSALHLAFLLFSIKDGYCRYPRFSIMDFECGDINEGRSHNLQKLITSSLEGLSGYQLIMTTSKIEPSLNNDKYGVGRYYDKNDYIIKN